MGCIYRENNKVSLASLSKDISYLLGISVAVLIIIIIINSILSLHSLVINLLAITGFIFFLYNLLKSCIFQYNYLLIDNELIIKRYIGKKEGMFINLNLRAIEYVKPLDRESKHIKSLKLYTRSKMQNIYLIKAVKDGREIVISFSPSERLIEKIITQVNSMKGY